MWIAHYADGTSVNSDECPYRNLNRASLVEFEVVLPGGTSRHVAPSGHGLVFRRRNFVGPEGRKSFALLWWDPLGPLTIFDLETGESEEFENFDRHHPLAYPPEWAWGEPTGLTCFRGLHH